MRYQLSPLIRDDLDEIGAWIAQDDPQRAIQVLRRLHAEFGRIAQHPMLYRLRPEIGDEVRLAVVGRHILLFSIDGDVVRFERVVYGGRDLPSLLLP